MGTLALRSQYRQLRRLQQSATAMAPILNSAFNFDQIHQDSTVPTMSRTHQYRKVMKPLQKLKHQKMLHVNPALDEDRFRSGFTACANEVSRFLSSVPGVNLQFGTDLMSHLGSGLTKATSTSPLSVNTVSTSASQAPLPLSPISDGGYNSGRDSTPSPALSVGSEDIPQHIIKQEVIAPVAASNSSVWRPF